MIFNFILLLYVICRCISSSIVELNNQTLNAINSTVNKNEMWMVMFSTPWCKQCYSLLPILDEVSSISTVNISIGVIYVDKLKS